MSKLDRLTALLEGLAPKVTLANAPSGFALHILAEGDKLGKNDVVDQLQLVACPKAYNRRYIDEPPDKNLICWMSFNVHFDGPVANLFLTEISEPIVINLESADPSLLQIVRLIANERLEPRCGQPLLMDRAGDILLIGVLRHLIATPQHNRGLFFALSNPRIAKSIVAMHEDISKNWSLEALADVAGMSRTSFINHFKEIMQVSPGKYLESLRLAVTKRLTDSGKSLQEVAAKTGYASASTLSRALKRISS